MATAQSMTKITSQIGEKTSHWFLEAGTSFDEAEKMAIDLLQAIGQLKTLKQQEQQAAAEEKAPVPDIPQEVQNV